METQIGAEYLDSLYYLEFSLEINKALQYFLILYTIKCALWETLKNIKSHLVVQIPKLCITAVVPNNLDKNRLPPK